MTYLNRLTTKRFFSMALLFVGLFMFVEPTFAAATAGGGLPFDSWLTKIQNSITGPFAFTASILGIVGAGATMIFGGDMNGFMRTMITIVLVLSFVIAAQNTLQVITGKGAEITKPVSLLLKGDS